MEQPLLIQQFAGHCTPNPCVLRYGRGPEGAKCKTCRHLFYRQMSKRYYKCALRANTGGPATDHRVRWPACAKYEEVNDGV